MGSILGSLLGGGGPEQAIGGIIQGVLGSLTGGGGGSQGQGGGDSIGGGSSGGGTLSTIMNVAELAAMFF